MPDSINKLLNTPAKFVGQVQDSLLFERLDVCNTCCVPPYHWIEDGTYEDFRRNILESDLADIISFDFATAAYALTGVATGRMTSRDANIMEAPLGTHVVHWEALRHFVSDRNAHWVYQDFAKAEETLLAMLLARPEMKA